MTDRGIELIGIFKLAKAATLLLVGVGTLSLLDLRIRESAMRHISQLSGDAHFRMLGRIVNMLGVATNGRIELIGLGSFFYAALFTIEGIGLLLQKRWAEFFTAIVTATFLPIEIYEIARRPDALKFVVLGINIAVLFYLIWRLKR